MFHWFVWFMVGLRRGVVSQQNNSAASAGEQAGANGMNRLIFGLGNAGLPLRLQYARSGIRVPGLDVCAKNFPRSPPVAASSGIFPFVELTTSSAERIVRAWHRPVAAPPRRRFQLAPEKVWRAANIRPN
jgi:hypothetical protein